MAQYSIKDLENLSGIKAHTIRIWEQRYNILNPKRTETNIRFYDDTDLKSILNISLLNEHGFKISRIAKMSGSEIAEAVMTIADKTVQYPQQMNTLILAMIEMDEERFDRTLSTIILQKGLERAMLDIICPFLIKVGILWQAGSISPAQEHFVSNIIRQKIVVAIDGQVIAKPSVATRYLLFLPEGELHEIGLLFVNYLLRARNHHVVYLGQNLPFPDLETSILAYQPHFILTVFTSVPEREHMQPYLNALAAAARAATVYVCGPLVHQEHLTFPGNLSRINSLPEFIDHLNNAV